MRNILSGNADVGDMVDIILICADDENIPTDPDSLTVYVQPAMSEATAFYFNVAGKPNSPELQRTGAGTFTLEYLCAKAGRHQVRAETVGNTAAEPGYFDVQKSNIRK